MSATAQDARGAIDDAHRTIEQLAGDDESELELFPQGSLAGDPKTTLKNLVKAGVETKLVCSLSKAEVPLQGGLVGLEDSGEVLVTYVAGKLEVVPDVEETDGKRRLKSVKLRQNLRSVYVRQADQMYTREQVLDLLSQADVPDSKVTELLGTGE